MRVIQTFSIFIVLIAYSYSNPIRPHVLNNVLRNSLKYIGGTSSKTYRFPMSRELLTVEKVWPPVVTPDDASEVGKVGTVLDGQQLKEEPANVASELKSSLNLKNVPGENERSVEKVSMPNVQNEDPNLEKPSDVEKQWSWSRLQMWPQKSVEKNVNDAGRNVPEDIQ